MSQYDEILEVWSAPEVMGTYTVKLDWEAPTLVLTSRASVQPDRQFEVRSPERDLSQIRYNVYLPYTEAIESTHRIKWRGDWYEIDGIPALWPYGATRHTALIIWRAANG